MAVKKSTTKIVKKKKSASRLLAVSLKPYLAAKHRLSAFLSRRPHRSFRRTRRRDYKRSLALPGYWLFTFHVAKAIWRGRKLLFGAVILYAIVMAAVVGIASQDTYTQLGQTVSEATAELSSGGLGQISQAGLLLVGTISGNLNGAVTTEAQIYVSILSLLLWLVLVWLLRSQLAGRTVKLRDAVYNSGGPIIPTLMVIIVLVIQLFPLAIATIAYAAASQTGMLSGGVVAMLVWTSLILIGVLSLYWSISTVIALVVVTLPGMYPMEAIRISGDLIIGRRLRVVLRLLWLIIAVLVLWAVIMIPIILFDGWIKGILPAITWLPIVPISVLAMSSFTSLIVASYVYILYRKIVEDDASPA